MNASQQDKVEVPETDRGRAAQLAETITAAEAAASPDLFDPWTVQDVISAALRRGLDALEQEYLKDGQQ